MDENLYTWKDIVKIGDAIYVEEFPISGEMDGEDIYQIDDFLSAVSDKYNVDIDKIETYMMDHIEFDPKTIGVDPADCGCYINGIPEWFGF